MYRRRRRRRATNNIRANTQWKILTKVFVLRQKRKLTLILFFFSLSILSLNMSYNTPTIHHSMKVPNTHTEMLPKNQLVCDVGVYKWRNRKSL